VRFFSILLLFATILWAEPSTVTNTQPLVMESDGVLISIPIKRQSQSVCIDSSHWEALVLLAKSQTTCKADWNSLLEHTSKRDSLCNASLSELSHQVDTQTLRLQNYQSSWDELLRNQEACQNTLAQCTSKGLEVIQQSPPPSQNKSWLWGLLALVLGFTLGAAFF